MEFFIAWYSGNPYERFTFHEPRASARTGGAIGSMITCNVIVPQFFWFKWFRQNLVIVFILSILAVDTS